VDNAVDTKALWNISYGLYVVTSIAGDRKNGQIVNSIIQVCAEIPRIAVSINKENLTHEYIQKSGVLAVTVLEQEDAHDLYRSVRFQERQGRGQV